MKGDTQKKNEWRGKMCTSKRDDCGLEKIFKLNLFKAITERHRSELGLLSVHQEHPNTEEY